MHFYFNALAASAGSGLTYVRNVAQVLARRNDLRATFLLQPELRREMGRYPNIVFEEAPDSQSAARRFLWEQSNVPKLILRAKANVLVSAGNFALRKSPVPQILLSGNSLYTSQSFRRDLLARREYRLWADNAIKSSFAARSVQWADRTVAPSEAFAGELRQWTGSRKVVAIHHGFDPDFFFADETPLPRGIQDALDATQGCLRLLFVSHYNYFRNFETLFRGLKKIREMLPQRNTKLLLTTRLRFEENPGASRPEAAAALVRELGLNEHVLELGAVPYCHLHKLYRACDMYVTAAYAETFAHPLVEAMACGVPIVASDLPAHQEVAGDAAVYFPHTSDKDFCARVLEVDGASELTQMLSRNGLKRSADLSWEKHLESLVRLARSLLPA